jgi:hypothetical protein
LLESLAALKGTAVASAAPEQRSAAEVLRVARVLRRGQAPELRTMAQRLTEADIAAARAVDAASDALAAHEADSAGSSGSARPSSAVDPSRTAQLDSLTRRFDAVRSTVAQLAGELDVAEARHRVQQEQQAASASGSVGGMGAPALLKAAQARHELDRVRATAATATAQAKAQEAIMVGVQQQLQRLQCLSADTSAALQSGDRAGAERSLAVSLFRDNGDVTNADAATEALGRLAMGPKARPAARVGGRALLAASASRPAGNGHRPAADAFSPGRPYRLPAHPTQGSAMVPSTPSGALYARHTAAEAAWTPGLRLGDLDAAPASATRFGGMQQRQQQHRPVAAEASLFGSLLHLRPDLHPAQSRGPAARTTQAAAALASGLALAVASQETTGEEAVTEIVSQLTKDIHISGIRDRRMERLQAMERAAAPKPRPLTENEAAQARTDAASFAARMGIPQLSPAPAPSPAGDAKAALAPATLAQPKAALVAQKPEKIAEPVVEKKKQEAAVPAFSFGGAGGLSFGGFGSKDAKLEEKKAEPAVAGEKKQDASVPAPASAFSFGGVGGLSFGGFGSKDAKPEEKKAEPAVAGEKKQDASAPAPASAFSFGGAGGLSFGGFGSKDAKPEEKKAEPAVAGEKKQDASAPAPAPAAAPTAAPASAVLAPVQEKPLGPPSGASVPVDMQKAALDTYYRECIGTPKTSEEISKLWDTHGPQIWDKIEAANAKKGKPAGLTTKYRPTGASTPAASVSEMKPSLLSAPVTVPGATAPASGVFTAPLQVAAPSTASSTPSAFGVVDEEQVHKDALLAFYRDVNPAKATTENVSTVWNKHKKAVWPALTKHYDPERVRKYAPPGTQLPPAALSQTPSVVPAASGGFGALAQQAPSSGGFGSSTGGFGSGTAGGFGALAQQAPSSGGFGSSTGGFGSGTAGGFGALAQQAPSSGGFGSSTGGFGSGTAGGFGTLASGAGLSWGGGSSGGFNLSLGTR